ncbi:hypothetical protein PM082_007252 [Marasmius tenuissimus]|nr:hypothetical protein PM082_007252 [Marasmius tenuissimus]
MSHYNSLHSNVSTSQMSSYSSLSGALTYNQNGNASHPTNPLTRKCRVPQTPYVPSSKWRAQTGRAHPLNGTISFDLIGLQGQGIPLREVRTRGPQGLQQAMQGANDMILGHTQLRKIAFHIRWPGYEHSEWIRSIDVATPQGPITRAQLAMVISQNFARYIEKNQYEATREIQWRLGPGGGIQFDHIVLLSLTNVFEDAWQADVAVEFR